MKSTSIPTCQDIAQAVTASLGNDTSFLYPASSARDFSGLKSGEFYTLGNDANLDAALLSQPLTEFATGVPANQDLQRLNDSLFPPVRTSLRFDYLTYDEKSGFIDRGTGNQDRRALGGEFATVARHGTQTTGRTYSKGLMMVLDEDEGGDDPAVQQQAAAELTAELLLAEFIRGIALVEAAASSTSKTWSSGTSVTPDADLAARVNASGDARGIDSNIAVFGNGAWLARFGACQRNANPGVSAASLLTPAQVAGLLGLDAVELAKVRKQSTASAKASALNSIVYTYYASRVASRRDPSNIKTFRSSGLQTYVITELKRTKIVVCHHSDIVVTNSVGIEKLAIS